MCTTLGEFCEKNPSSWARLDPTNPDPTSNIRLQFTLTAEDREPWDLMDEATYQTIAAITGKEDAVEYWDEGTEYSWVDQNEASIEANSHPLGSPRIQYHVCGKGREWWLAT